MTARERSGFEQGHTFLLGDKEMTRAQKRVEQAGVSSAGVRLRRRFLIPAVAMALWLTGAVGARASIAVLVEQPYGHLGTFSPGGHAAIYLDHVCAETPVRLRQCGPGELGVVISRYDGIQHLDWVATPLMGYLYAVDSAAEIPETMDREREIALRDQYRRAHLQLVAPDTPEGVAPGGNWYELAGAAYDRTIYGFSLRTTAQQDENLIAILNDRKNVERYNGMFANCADFARVAINRFYPHAIRRNFIADFGVTSPKAVAKQLTRYGMRHPEAGLEVFKIPQVKGSLPRSHSNQGVSEALVRRYGLPMALVSPVTAGVVLAAYVGKGRFEMPKHAPTMDLSLLEAEAREMEMAAEPGAIGDEQLLHAPEMAADPGSPRAELLGGPPSLPRVQPVPPAGELHSSVRSETMGR